MKHNQVSFIFFALSDQFKCAENFGLPAQVYRNAKVAATRSFKICSGGSEN